MAGLQGSLRGCGAPIRADLGAYGPISERLAYARPSLDCVDAQLLELLRGGDGHALLAAVQELYATSILSAPATTFYQTLLLLPRDPYFYNCKF